MFIFGYLLGGRRRRQPREAQTGYSTVQYRHDSEGRGVLLWLFISHQLIRYESSRRHKIDGTKSNQTGINFEEKNKIKNKKQGKKADRRERTSK